MGSKVEKQARKLIRKSIANQIQESKRQLQARLRAPWKWLPGMKKLAAWQDIENFPKAQYRYEFRYSDQVKLANGEEFSR